MIDKEGCSRRYKIYREIEIEVKNSLQDNKEEKQQIKSYVRR